MKRMYDFSKFAKDADPHADTQRERVRLKRLIQATEESLKRPMGHVPRGREEDDLRRLKRQLADLGEDAGMSPGEARSQNEISRDLRAAKSRLAMLRDPAQIKLLQHMIEDLESEMEASLRVHGSAR